MIPVLYQLALLGVALGLYWYAPNDLQAGLIGFCLANLFITAGFAWRSRK